VHIAGLVNDEQHAKSLVHALKSALGRDHVAVVERRRSFDGTEHTTELAVNEALHGTTTPLLTDDDTDATQRSTVDSPLNGAAFGAVVGGVLGLATASLMTPGASILMVTAGPAVSTTIGMIAGSMFGGIADLSVTPSKSNDYSRAVERGATLLVAQIDDHRREDVEHLFRMYGATEVSVF
jgi:outer membrane lipoprotein SlyB